MTLTQLDWLKSRSTVVADTGDFQQMARFQPRDATTNPTLVLKAVRMASYAPLLARVCREHPSETLPRLADRLLVAFGQEILTIVPGRVSTEVDARLSFDTEATVNRALAMMVLYEQAGVDRSRVLIKIAATWEGIQAAQRLRNHGIDCNLTLVFGLHQAMACADAGVKLISPFVGRILDWHKKSAGAAWNDEAAQGIADPGVRSVAQIFGYYKRHRISTEVMAASFRNVGEILALAGCDLLTISPDLLGELASLPLANEPASVLNDEAMRQAPDPRHLDEAEFRRALNQDAMATEKLAEGIRQFEADAIALEDLIRAALAARQ